MHNNNGIMPDERAHGNEDHAIEPRAVHPEDERLLLRALVVDELDRLLDGTEEEEVRPDLDGTVEERVAGKRDHDGFRSKYPRLRLTVVVMMPDTSSGRQQFSGAYSRQKTRAARGLSSRHVRYHSGR